jgi:hypothetical protein
MTKKSRDGIVKNAFLNVSLIFQEYIKMVIHGIQTLVAMIAPEHAQVLSFLRSHAASVNAD